MVPGGVRNLIGTLHLNELLMRPRIGIQQLPNHLLILRIVFLRLRLKEIHALFAEGHGYLYGILTENQFMRRRQKILYYFGRPLRSFSVFYFLAHKPSYSYASTPRQIFSRCLFDK